MPTRAIPCTDCDIEKQRFEDRGFRVLGCAPIPERPGMCAISFERLGVAARASRPGEADLTAPELDGRAPLAANASRLSAPSAAFTQALLGAVQAELDLWKSQQLVECIRDPATGTPVGNPATQVGAIAVSKFWREGLGDMQRNGCSDFAWSAAFICFCLRRAGVRLDDFPFSAGHHTYIRWAINNSKQDKPAKLYYGMRVETYRPQPGDMIAQWRKARPEDPDPQITFDNQPDEFYSSHCDIVTAASSDRVVAVGGNLSNRVKESSFGALNGLLKPKKELICILRLAGG